jgi:hypothetical protein
VAYGEYTTSSLMKQDYDSRFDPPPPILAIRLSAAAEVSRGALLTAIVDTGADGTLIPSAYLEEAGAIGVGDAVLRSVLGEVREVHLYPLVLSACDLHPQLRPVRLHRNRPMLVRPQYIPPHQPRQHHRRRVAF